MDMLFRKLLTVWRIGNGLIFLISVLIGLDNFVLGLAHGSFVLEILYYCLEDWKLVLFF